MEARPRPQEVVRISGNRMSDEPIETYLQDHLCGAAGAVTILEAFTRRTHK